VDPLPPLPPLPPLGSQRKRRLLGWATVIALASALAAGIFHSLGNKLFDAAWRYFHRRINLGGCQKVPLLRARLDNPHLRGGITARQLERLFG
jgi:hypothetical protein